MDFHELLGESVTADAIDQLEQGLSEAIEQIVDDKDFEIYELTEKAERFAEIMADERQASLVESMEAYKLHLEQDFAVKEAEYVERIANIKESAKEYGKYIYDDIVEKADEYTSQYVEEFKSVNESMFEAIQAEETAKDVLLNVKHVFESFGMDTDQNQVIRDLRDKLQESNSKITLLNNSLYENDIETRKKIILDELTEGLSLNEQQVIVSAASDILTENVNSFKNVVSIMVSKYKKDDDSTFVKNSEKRIFENQKSQEQEKIVSFDGMRNGKQTIAEINRQII